MKTYTIYYNPNYPLPYEMSGVRTKTLYWQLWHIADLHNLGDDAASIEGLRKCGVHVNIVEIE